MTTRTEIDFDRLEAIVKGITNIFEINKDDDNVTFKFKDKDKDIVLVVVNELDEERIVAVTLLRMPEGRIIASLMAVNNWNQRKDAHGTFAYMTKVEDTFYVLIESHLMLRGGVEEENIKLWVKNLINHINPFEEQIMSTLNEIGEDSEILTSSGSGGSNIFLDTILGEGATRIAKTIWDRILG